MIRRREELHATIKSRRRGKGFANDHSAAGAGSPVGKTAVGKDKTKESDLDPWCKRSNVTYSSPLDVTVSTTSMSTNCFDKSFNSGETDINAHVASPDGCSTPIVNKMVRFGISFDDGDRSSMREKILNKNQTHSSRASVVSPEMPAESSGWTSSLSPEMGLTPEKAEKEDRGPFSDDADNDWDPFGGNADEFALESPTVKVSFDDVEVGALESPAPVCVNDMKAFTRKELDKTKTSQSSSVKKSSVKEEMRLSLREENERLKNEIKEASEEAGTLDAAEALVQESYRGSIADECTLEEGTLETSFYEDTVDTGIVDEGTLETDCDTIDEGASYNSRSQGDWDDVTLESDFESETLGSASASPPRKRNSIRNVKHAGPSSRTLRQALRRQSKSGAVTSTCPLVFEELMGTYQDASDAFNQVLDAFFVSLDDVDKVSDAIGGVKKELCMSHSDRFAPRSKRA